MKAKNYDQKRKDLKKLKKEVMEQGFEDSRHRKSFKQDIKRSFRSLKRSEKQTIAIEKEIEWAPQLNWIEHLTTDQEVQGSSPYGVTIFIFLNKSLNFNDKFLNNLKLFIIFTGIIKIVMKYTNYIIKGNVVDLEQLIPEKPFAKQLVILGLLPVAFMGVLFIG